MYLIPHSKTVLPQNVECGVVFATKDVAGGTTTWLMRLVRYLTMKMFFFLAFFY